MMHRDCAPAVFRRGMPAALPSSKLPTFGTAVNVMTRKSSPAMRTPAPVDVLLNRLPLLTGGSAQNECSAGTTTTRVSEFDESMEDVGNGVSDEGCVVIRSDINVRPVPTFRVAPSTARLPPFTSRLHRPAARAPQRRRSPQRLFPRGPTSARVCWETSLWSHGMLCKF